MFDWHILGIYLVLFCTFGISFVGLILGVIKRDYILQSFQFGPRRINGLTAVLTGLSLFIICGVISLIISVAILKTPNLPTINYLLLALSFILPLTLVLLGYRKPVNTPVITPAWKFEITFWWISAFIEVVIITFLLMKYSSLFGNN